MMLILFTLTLFIGSTLLFLVEPMFAKMVLPLLGGTPAVWNTCMVFFQSALLMGYAYAHWAASRVRPHIHFPVHIGIMLLPLALLPIGISNHWIPPREMNPIPWLLLLMAATVGLPFVVLSATAPVMQKWFSTTDHSTAHDPYFLYAASNLGSFTGLIGYLVIMEPNFTLAQQSRIWSYGYALLILLSAACAWSAWKNSKRIPAVEAISHETVGASCREPIPMMRRLRWIALAFVPSSLMLGTTTFLTTDIASIPLLWVIPLALYLLTFVFVFARHQALPSSFFTRLMPILVLVQTVMLSKLPLPMPWLPFLYLLTFFSVAMACHSELAKDRPDAPSLTEFYLLMSVGGVLGGTFNALIAPLVFRSIVEYPIVLVLACMIVHRPGTGSTVGRHAFGPADVLLPIGVGLLAACVGYAAQPLLSVSPQLYGLSMGIVALVSFTFVERPIRFGLSVAVVLLVVGLNIGGSGQLLHQERGFFGVLRVTQDARHEYNSLVNGTTLHGMQSLDINKRREALTYYYRTGPIGQVFEMFNDAQTMNNVAIVGLGAGSLASYIGSGQTCVFYEIDPAVERIAYDARYFTFLRDCRSRGGNIKVVLGDARTSIVEAPDKAYNFIVLDAFSSDSIPMHLLTRQALRLYLRKLSEHGLIAFHITNRYMDLKPVIANLAADSGLSCLYRADWSISAAEQRAGKVHSIWTLLTRHSEDFGNLNEDTRWQILHSQPKMQVWTDDFSNIVDILRLHGVTAPNKK